MKVSKSLLQAIAVAVTIGAATACTKEQPVNPEDPKQELKKRDDGDGFSCITCGRG
jgi:hypothetical protein